MEEKNAQLKKFENMLEAIERIKEMQSKSNESVFIELIGTPRSGKTTLQNVLAKLFKDNEVQYVARKSLATYCPIKPENDMYNLWITSEVLKKVAIDMSKRTSKIVIYDGGMLDRIPWLKYDIARGSISRMDYERLLSNYDISIYKKYKPISRVFKASPEIASSRKKNGKESISRYIIEDYNNMLDDSINEMKERSRSFKTIDTDQYGNDLKRMAVDCIPDILTEVEKELYRQRSYKNYDD